VRHGRRRHCHLHPPRRAVRPAYNDQKSPECGYAHQHISKGRPNDAFTVTATMPGRSGPRAPVTPGPFPASPTLPPSATLGTTGRVAVIRADVAASLRMSRPTLAKWRSRFLVARVAGLSDEPRPGRPRTVSDEQVADLIARTLESAPANATHWSTRSMAARTGLSQSTVSRVWRAFGLQPHRVPPALHPDRLVLAQPGRTLVRRNRQQTDTPRHPPIRPGAGEEHPNLDRRMAPSYSSGPRQPTRSRSPRRIPPTN
jgi:transposase